MKLEPGMLAIVINASDPANIGIICRVLRYTGNSQCGRYLALDTWLVESVSRPFVFTAIHYQPSVLCNCSSWALRPISGLPDDETIDTHEPVQESV
jgi:hypothetical protein